MVPFTPFSANGDGREPITLILGDMQRWLARDAALPVLDGLSFADVTDLDAALLLRLNPDIVMSPLVVRDTDAVEIARILGDLHYAGRYRVVSEEIPNDTVIRAEVSAVAPDLDFAVVALPEHLFGP